MKNLLTIDDLDIDEIEKIFSLAKDYQKDGIPKCLEDKVVFSLFFESSTRTNTSFVLATKKLGALVQEISSNNLASTKGEELIDIISTLNALNPDLFIIRHNESGIFHLLKKYITCSIINAGDGTNEHPTQSLIDLFTILQYKKSVKGLNITICGDLLHSRVAHSGVKLFEKFGVNLSFVAPPTLMPGNLKSYPHFSSISDGVKNADVVIVLRLQKERMQSAYISSEKEYAKFFGLNAETLKHAKKDVIIMHPGPVNRGVEITSDVINCKNSVILQQVTNGLFVRAAIVNYLLSD